MFIVIFLILLQIAILAYIITALSKYWIYGYAFFVVLSLIVVLWVINTNNNPSYKLAWCVPILVFPLFGGLFYVFFGNHNFYRRYLRKHDAIIKRFNAQLEQNQEQWEMLRDEDSNVVKQAHYIRQYGGYPVHQDTTVDYFPSGETFFADLLEALNRAEHYIFLEYFILREGKMWSAVLEILQQKVQSGLDVRVIYDDVGCLNTLPYNYHKKLEKMGIHTEVFNPMLPLVRMEMNNRDHRKIVVIDGYVAYTGGINLSDEYINQYLRYGHWKDSAIRLQGSGVWNMTMMFLQTWNILRPDERDADLEKYRPERHHPQSFDGDGWVQPFGDSPLDAEMVSEQIYLNLINNARQYVYIMTPYLIIDQEMIIALSLAAKSGIDVRIITPHIPDKWYVHLMSRAFYGVLLKAGVKIYEYTPGFVHAKSFVVDDELAVVGTANLDFRSLYLHYECGVWLYRNRAIMHIKNDYMATLADCQEVDLDHSLNRRWWQRIIASILMLFAPLM